MAERGPDRERVARARELYIAVRAQPDGEREAFLVSVCGENRPLLDAVRALLAEQTAGAAGSPDVKGLVSDQILDLIDEPSLIGQSIGPYRLLEIIGEGGFGVVYLAERREPFVQRVALKVIKPGMDSKAVVARFEQERQALAVMDHPNIAKVFDAGTTPPAMGSRPYFVMEHVKGEPITDLCDRLNLSIRERLELFIPVCKAVQHAHMKGVIHRDIKPSNVLVSIPDTASRSSSSSSPSPLPSSLSPLPKVIDFGVSKAITGTMTDKTIFTEHGVLIGTPEYMSPEQAEMGALDIDTRTDVYSLGVVLYELLTGALPFDRATLRAAGLDEIRRIIREVDPPRPSTRLTSLGAGGLEVANKRQMEQSALERELHRELEWVPLKALRKDRQERYPTPMDLANDVRNYLDGRPLIAGPESAGYRVRKFVRRNKGTVTTVSMVAAIMVLATSVSVWFGLRESAARNQESKALARAEAINAFVTSALKASDPSEGGTQSTTIAEAMEGAINDIENGAFNNDPQTEAGLKDTIATILQNNGRAADAEPLFLRALETRQRLFTGDHPDVASSLNNLAGVRLELGRVTEAEPLYVEALEMTRRLIKGDDPGVATSLNNLAYVWQALGRAADAEPLYVDALEMHRRLFKGDHPDLATSLSNLARARQALGKTAEARQAFDEAIAMQRRLTPNGSPDLARYLWRSASARLDNSDAAATLPELEEAAAMAEKFLPPEHPHLKAYRETLAKCNAALGK